MSEESNHPTQEEIRQARHEGFNDSVAHMDQEKRERLSGSFQAQDQRREANVSGFYESVQGGGGDA